jgi:hypothetical protein
MIKCDFLFIAQQAVVERGTNLVSAINIWDTLGGVSFPFVAPPFAVILRTRRDVNIDPEQPEFLLEIRNKQVVLFNKKIGVEYQGREVNNLVVTVGGLLIQEPSPLEISYKYGSEEIGKTVVKIEGITPKIEKKE